MTRFKSQILIFFFAITMTLTFVLSATPAFAIDIPACPTTDRWLTPIYQVLKPQADGKLCGMGAVTADIWQQVMNIVNSLVLASFIFIAFMNILRIQLDSYAVKKILPTFIMAVILANFSFLIARILLDFSNVFTSYFLVGDASTTTQYKISGVFDDLVKIPVPPPDGNEAYWGVIMSYGIKQLVAIAGAVMILILSFLFLIRNYYIYFLVAIAPAAYMSMVLPMTKKYFGQWWSQYTKWVFLPIVSVFWLWLAGRFMDVMTGTIWFLPAAFAILCFYMAMTSPFKLGGAAVTSWGNWGKKAWNKTGIPSAGKATWNATGGAAIKSGKEYVGFQYGVAKHGVKERARQLPVIRGIDRRAGQFRIAKDIFERKQKKSEDMRREQAFFRYTNSLTPEQLEKDKLLNSRISGFAGELRSDEMGDNYRNDKSLRDLATGMYLSKDKDGRWISASFDDFRKKSKLYTLEGKEVDKQEEWTDKDWIENYKTHSASGTELIRRSRMRNQDRPDGSFGEMNADEIAARTGLKGVGDTRTMSPKKPEDRPEFIPLTEGVPARLTQEQLRQLELNRQRERGNRNRGNGDDDDGQENPAPAVQATNREQYQPVANQPAQPVTATPATPQQVIAQENPELAGALQELVEALKTAEADAGIPKDSLAGSESIDKILAGLKKLQPDNVGLAATLLPTINANITGITPEAMLRLDSSMKNVLRATNKESALMRRGLEERNADSLRTIADLAQRKNELPPDQAERLASSGLDALGENPGTE